MGKGFKLRIRFLRQRLFDDESKPIAKRASLFAAEIFAKATGLARQRAADSPSEVARLKAALQQHPPAPTPERAQGRPARARPSYPRERPRRSG